MPKIPQYTSQERLTAETPSVRKNLQQEGIAGQQFAQVGETVQDVSLKFNEAMRKADAVKQTTEAELDVMRKYQGFSNKIASAKTDKELDSYVNEIPNLVSESSAMIKDQNARRLFENQYKVSVTKEALSAIRKKKISNGISTLNTALTEAENLYAETGDASHIARGITTLNNYNDAGYLTEKEFEKTVKEFNKSALYSDFKRNPESALSQLDSASGYAEKLDPQERADIKVKLLTQKKREEEAKKVFMSEQFYKNDKEVAIKVSRGELNEQDIDKMELLGKAGLEGGISSGVAASARKLLNSIQAMNPQDKADVFNSILSEYRALGDENNPKQITASYEKISKFRQHLIEARAKGAITQAKYEKWLSAVDPEFSNGISEEVKKAYGQKRSALGFLMNGANNLFQFAVGTGKPNASEEVVSKAKMELADELMDRISKEEKSAPISDKRVAEISQEIMKGFIRRNNPKMMGLEDVPNTSFEGVKESKVYEGTSNLKADVKASSNGGQLMVDSKGNKAIVYPDGRVEEIKS